MTSDYSLSDIKAVTEGNNGGGFGGWGGDWSAWIIIFLIFAAFGWGNNNGGGFFGGGSQGAADNYVLASDFSMLSRQVSDGFNAIERRTDGIVNGICDLGYTQQSLINGTNLNVVNGTNTIAQQLAQCLKKIKSKMSNLLNAKYTVGTCAA